MEPKFIEVNQYGGIKVVEYKGKIYLKSAKESDDKEKIYLDWVFRQEGRYPDRVAGKAMPLQINLGDISTASDVLVRALAHINSENTEALALLKAFANEIEEDDVPDFD